MTRAAKQGLLVLLVCSPFVFSGLFVTSLHDPEQGMYADIAATMAAGGEWITPRFNGIAYFNKPPLFFWLSALSMFLIGPLDWVARLWSALPALLTAVLVWLLGARIYGRNAGVLGAIVFVSNIGVLLYARVPSTDFLLVLWITLALYAFVATVLDPGGNWSVLLFYGSMALAVLTKGLLGLVLPAVVLAAYFAALLVWPGLSPQTGKRAIAGLRAIAFSRKAGLGWLLFFCLVLPWHVMAEIRNPGFFDYYVVDHQIGRFFGTRIFVEDDVPSGTVSFLAVSLLLFFPWSIFLPASLRMGLPPKRGVSSSPETGLRLMFGMWALSTLVFFSLSQSKLEHYGLPAFPAMSLMVGALWSESRESARPPRSLRWTLAAAALGLGAGGLLLAASVGRIGPRGWLAGLAEIDVYYRILKDAGQGFPFASVHPFVEFARGFGAALLAGFPLALIALLARRPRWSFACIVVTAGVIFFLGYRLAPVFEAQQSAKPVSLALLERVRAGDPIVHEGQLEYSAGLPFYTGHRVLVLNGRRGILEFGSHYPSAGAAFIDTKQFVDLWEGRGRVFLVTRFSPEHSAIQRLPKETVRALGKFGSKWLYTNQAMHSEP